METGLFEYTDEVTTWKDFITTPVKIKRNKSNARMPERGSDAAAGYDVFACLDWELQIPPHQTIKIDTGLSMEIPTGYWAGVFARSGLATKEGLRPANCVGVIDSDYRGSVIVALHNDSEEVRTIIPGEKIGQLILLPCYEWSIEEVNELSDTERGSGGFGSTGK